jgi:hypothetical protein
VWSKARRFLEGLDVVGDIITKTIVNYVIKLHVALLFTCLFLWVIICVVIIMFIFMAIACICCMCMFIVLPYEFVHL